VNFGLGNWAPEAGGIGLLRLGNRWQDHGGTLGAVFVCLVIKTTSKNPSGFMDYLWVSIGHPWISMDDPQISIDYLWISVDNPRISIADLGGGRGRGHFLDIF